MRKHWFKFEACKFQFENQGICCWIFFILKVFVNYKQHFSKQVSNLKNLGRSTTENKENFGDFMKTTVTSQSDESGEFSTEHLRTPTPTREFLQDIGFYSSTSGESLYFDENKSTDPTSKCSNFTSQQTLGSSKRLF